MLLYGPLVSMIHLGWGVMGGGGGQPPYKILLGPQFGQEITCRLNSASQITDPRSYKTRYVAVEPYSQLNVV